MIDLTALGTVPPPAAAASFIKETDEARFEADAFHASLERPVIVLFYSPASAMSKQLSATLDKLVTESGGAISLVKVNSNRSPGLVQALRIEAVPTVYVFYQGKPVDGFAGSKPEPELRAMVEKLRKLAAAGSPEEMDKAAIAEQVKKLMEEGDAFFKQGDLNAAMERYGLVMDIAPDNMEALGGIGWSLLAQGEAEAVRDMLSQLPPEQAAAPRLKGLQYILSLGDEAANIEALIDRLVAEVKKNREGEARPKLLEIFEALGPAHPLTAPGRRKLSTVLFS